MNAHPSNIEVVKTLRQRYYFSVLENNFDNYRQQHGVPTVGNYLTSIMREAQSSIESLLEQRVAAGDIRDISQARKSIAGNGFQSLVFLALLEMQKENFIPPQVIFVLKPKQHPVIKEYATIYSGEEILSPDLDLMAYVSDAKVVTIYSIKTSLRERAGQTHRWKLLLDIVTAPDAESIRKKYDMRFRGGKNFLMNLITTNFYNEITSPQQRGLLRFFDSVYLTKAGEFQYPILNFSQIAADLTAIYGE